MINAMSAMQLFRKMEYHLGGSSNLISIPFFFFGTLAHMEGKALADQLRLKVSS